LGNFSKDECEIFDKRWCGTTQTYFNIQVEILISGAGTGEQKMYPKYKIDCKTSVPFIEVMK